MSRFTTAAFVLLAGSIPARAQDLPDRLRPFVEAAEAKHGEAGGRAARFLIRGMPDRDRAQLAPEFLTRNLDLAFQARAEFPWGGDIPDDLFLNHVLPYANLDETREDWRPAMFERAREIVRGETNIAAAAQALNQQLFNRVGVHYSRERKRANQAPRESMDIGKASCTGLSILLVDACRAVGIPARVAGTPLWVDRSGNHSWVEVWDGAAWRYTGADEFDAKGLDRAWFGGKAATAIPDDWRHAIYATTWTPGRTHFPLVWDLDSRDVHAENVTHRYLREPTATKPAVRLRLLDRPGGRRVPARIETEDGAVHTNRHGRADWNDVVELPTQTAPYRLIHRGETRSALLEPATGIIELHWNELEIVATTTNDDPVAAVWATFRRERQEAANKILADRELRLGGHTMKYLEKVFGDRPEAGYPLFISMHGGGGAPARVNDSQWRNQIRLYEAERAVFVAPRAPTDTWNLWHQAHIDPLFDQLIAAYVIAGRVDPDRVYLLGYSAGGDGVYQLAPRMADRFAAASMMAGHPNEARPLGLRNLPFAIFCGGRDRAYDRNEVCAQWGEQLDKLQAEDPDGYPHRCDIYAGLGHWMNGRDRAAIPWMLEHRRDPWPTRVVWHQDDVVHDRFYWLGRPAGQAKKGDTIVAEVEGQTIRITTEIAGSIDLRLSDKLLDLNQPVVVERNGAEVLRQRVERDTAILRASLEERADPGTAASAILRVPAAAEP